MDPIAILIAVGALILVAVVLWDGFETIVLPRRVSRRLRLTRLFYRATWLLWRVPARRFLSSRSLENVLAYYGPLSLLFLIVVWAAALVFGFALIDYSLRRFLCRPGGAPLHFRPLRKRHYLLYAGSRRHKADLDRGAAANGRGSGARLRLPRPAYRLPARP